MYIAPTANGLQISRTRLRLMVSRMFGLSMLSLLVVSSSSWTGPAVYDDLLFVALHESSILPTWFLMP